MAITSELVGAGKRMPQVGRNCAKANVDLIAARRLAISLSFNNLTSLETLGGLERLGMQGSHDPKAKCDWNATYDRCAEPER